MQLFGKGLLEWFNNFVKMAGPVLIIVFTLAVFSGLIRWSYKTKNNLKEISKNPILIFIWILVSILGIYYFYKYAIPLIGG